MPRWLVGALAGLYRAELTAAIACLVVMAAVVFADVVGRELANQGLIWAQRVGVYAFIYAGFIGLPLATAAGEHLRPKFADGLMPSVIARHLPRLQHGVAALLTGAFAYYGVRFALQAHALEETSPVLNFPVWAVQIVFAYAFLSCALRHLAYAAFPVAAPSEMEGEF